jgi:hypothetical protein
MRPLSPVELARMTAVQTAAMPDECELLQMITGAPDAYGVPTISYTLLATTRCGMEHSQVKESASSEAGGQTRHGTQGTQVPAEMRQLRLPLGTPVTNVDRIRLTKRFGAAITPVLYEVIGNPQQGPSGLLVHVQNVKE